MDINLGLLFPAFGDEYLGTEKKIISKYSIDIQDYLNKANNVVNFDINSFNSINDGLFKEELQSQYAAYIYSCIFSDILKKHNIVPSYSSSYSMGIYACLYNADSINFEEGLLLIKYVFDAIMSKLKGFDFAMGVIAGLEEKDIKKIITENNINAEVINVNNKLSCTVSGLSKEIEKLLESAKSEGAFNTKLLPTKSCYHSKYINDAVSTLEKKLTSIKINVPKIKIISGINQKILTTEADVFNEIISNVHTHINWLASMTKMIELGINVFFECGAGKGLFKTARFIDGNFKIYTINNLEELIKLIL